MRIRQVSWSNFRRLPDAAIDIREHLVLIGPNDSGKSSVLRALQMCLAMTHAQLTTAITSRDFTDERKTLVLRVRLGDLEERDQAAFPDEVTVGDELTVTMVVEATLDEFDPDRKSIQRYFPDGGHNHGPTREQIKQIGFAYVPAVRSLFRELGGSSGGAMRSLLTGVDLSADAEALQVAAAGYQQVLDDSQALKSLRNELAAALARALPVPVDEEDVRVATDAAVAGDPLTGVGVTLRQGDRDVPLAEQSDGVRALSVLTLLGLSHRSARVVAIDEPETHLHPTAQRSVARSLRDSHGQRLLATHSAHVVGEMNPLHVVAFRADGQVRQLPANSPVADADSVRRHWSAQLIEPLTARRLLIVEGPSDRIIVRRVAELLDIDLDRAGVAILELEGSGSFPRAHRLFGPAGFDVPFVGLCDEDARESWADAVGVEPADVEAAGFVVCDADLEHVYVKRLGVQTVIGLLVADDDHAKRSLIRSCKVEAVTDLSCDALLAYCRSNKHKVQAALAVARGLRTEHARALVELGRVITLAIS